MQSNTKDKAFFPCTCCVTNPQYYRSMKKRYLLLLILILASNTQLIINYNMVQAEPSTNVKQVSAKRVVALTSLSADILHRLDSTKLVGIPGVWLLNQTEGFDRIERVSEGRTQPNLEKIVALKPDLVVGSEDFHRDTLQKLEQLGIPTLTAKVDSWASLEALTKNLALSINADPKPLLKQYQTLLAPQTNSQLSTLVLVSRQPILAPNKNSWAGDMLAKFNLKNLAAQLQGESQIQGYITLSPEKILQADPDVIFLVENDENILEQFKSQPWSQLKAVKNDQVYVFDYYGLVNPGSIDAIAKTCNKLKSIGANKL